MTNLHSQNTPNEDPQFNKFYSGGQNWNFDRSGTIGFWGIPTSTVDWCESNYAISYYIAEFFNSMSNLITISCGIFLFLFSIHNKLEARFSIASLALTLVGLGSFAFHGTLLYEAQMLDELPMIYTTLVLSYCVFENKPRRQYRYFRLFLITVGIAFSFVHTLGKFVVVFHVIFGVLLVPVIVYPFRFWHDKELRAISVTMTGMFGLAFAAWKADQMFCPDLEKLYLHAFWHIFTAIPAGLWIMFMMFIRLRYTYGQEVKFKYVLGFIPFIERNEKRYVSVNENKTPLVSLMEDLSQKIMLRKQNNVRSRSKRATTISR